MKEITSLSHQFDLLYHNSKLHGRPDRPKGKAVKLKGLILIVESEILSSALHYGDVKVGIARDVTHSLVCKDNLIDSGVSILRVSTFRNLFRELRSKNACHSAFTH